MFTLVTDRSKYFRVNRGQNSGEIERVLKTPAFNAFAGAIIEVAESGLIQYSAEVGDTYKSIALKYSADEEKLKKINANRPVYPTCKLFVPCK